MSVHVCLRVCVSLSLFLSLAMKKKRAGLRWGAAPSSWPVTQLPVKRSSVYHRTTAQRRPLRPAPPSYFLPTRCDSYPLPAVFFPLFRSTTDTWLTSPLAPPSQAWWLRAGKAFTCTPVGFFSFFFSFFFFEIFYLRWGTNEKNFIAKRNKEHNPKACRPHQKGFALRILFKFQGSSTGYMADPSPLGSTQVKLNYKGFTRFSPSHQ